MMSDKAKPDRHSLGVAIDYLEAAGFAEQVPVFRAWIAEKCRPTVAEVLPLAIAFLRRFPSGMDWFFRRRDFSDETIRSWRDQSPATEVVRLCELLLEMTVNQRHKVASRARDAVDRERRERQWSDSGAATPLADMLEMRDRIRQASIGQPAFRLPHQIPTHVVEDGIRMEVVETGDDPRDGHYLIARHPGGHLRRFSGVRLADVIPTP